MKLSDEKREDLFALVQRLGEMEPGELKSHFKEDVLASLRLAAEQLRDGLVVERYLSERRFVEIVRELHETMRIWSGRLEQTLQSAGEASAGGDARRAIWILRGFAKFCPSAHYRSVAEEAASSYEKE
ncbi:MAG: hypothetical protein JSV00_00735 [bacterium]|nr:MAG: hypothetical protein JSV00_00735 [bacterium]